MPRSRGDAWPWPVLTRDRDCRTTHPSHILPLLDSGQAEDLLYYLMPFIEGESLPARLSAERCLPTDCVRLTSSRLQLLGRPIFQPRPQCNAAGAPAPFLSKGNSHRELPGNVRLVLSEYPDLDSAHTPAGV